MTPRGLDVCGKAVEKDRAALIAKREAVRKEAAGKTGVAQKEDSEVEPIPNSVLQDFARERAKLVKGSLVNDHGVNHERIYLCLPAIDQEPDKEPHVEMLID